MRIVDKFKLRQNFEESILINMLEDNLKSNLTFQTLYQLLNVGLPLITSPFLSRVLGAEALGIMSYSSSVVHYSCLFAMMGLVNYGTRSIAIVKNDLEKRSKVFSQIYTLQLITASLSTLLYICFVSFFIEDNSIIFLIQGLAVLACLFDINWFFFGMEYFKITITRSIIIRLLSVTLMFFLIRSPKDLWIYAVLLVGSQFISQIVLWFYLPKCIKHVKFSIKSSLEHFAPNLKLFIPLLAMSVYHIMDKTMLGTFSTYVQSGFYYNVDKVINIPVGVITGIGTVMLPHMTMLVSSDRKVEYNQALNATIKTVCFASVAICFGVSVISKEFTLLFFGKGFDECVILIIMLSPALILKSFSMVSNNLYLVPNKMEYILTCSVIAGALVNLIANLFLIPSFGARGAVIGTLCAETVSCLLQYIVLFRKINCKDSILECLIYIAIGLGMFLSVRFASTLLNYSALIKVAFEIVLSGIIYIGICMIYWKTLNKKDVYNILRMMIHKRRRT